MKLTEKYCLCDMCSKLVEHLEDDKMAKFLYFPSKSILFQYERFKQNIVHRGNIKLSYLFDFLEVYTGKYLCSECIKNLYKDCFPIKFPFYFPVEKRQFPLSSDAIKQDVIEVLGFDTDGRIEFAEAKNKKIREIYFTPINVQIENSKVGNGEE